MNANVISREGDALHAGAVYAKVSRRLLPFLFICYMIAYLDRINISFAKLQMLSALRMSDAVYGLGAGVFFVGYLLFEIPSNLLLLKVGARRWIARIMVTWGILSTNMMFVKSPASFYVLRFLLGVAEAGFIPAVLLYLTHWFPAYRQSKATALFLTGIPMSGVIGGPVSGWLLSHFSGTLGLAGWQWLFFLEGLPAIVIGVIAFFYLDDDVPSARWLSSAEKTLILRDVADDEGGHKMHSVRDGLSNPRVLLLGLIYFFFIMGLYGVTFWLPTIVKATGVTDALKIGLLSAVPYVAAVLAMILTSRSSDATGERRWHLALAGFVGAAGLCGSVAFAQTTALALCALTMGTMGVMTTISQFWALPSRLLTGAAAAAGIAFVNSIGQIAGLISPVLVGWIQVSTGTATISVLGLALSMVIGGLLVFWVPGRLVNVRREAIAG
ncbi:MFS transporter [Paraburkholderia largidicola]|uniref:Permease n=1 Tax=Paraburkholderia largidicola TaxID=3014751 RepID=A0A7I8C3K2_9BURK|nr:MFS transporter [Paraburkholderia sp. PGU16]BCF95071.1 permease [Paraburkholderia sp. PGU16]